MSDAAVARAVRGRPNALRAAAIALLLTVAAILVAASAGGQGTAQVTAQTTSLLAGNTGQTPAASGHSISGGDRAVVQIFATGTNSGGYFLDSVGIGFHNIESAATAGDDMQVAIAKAGSDPFPNRGRLR